MYRLQAELSRILISDFVANELPKGHFETRENTTDGTTSMYWIARGVSSKDNGSLVSLHHIFEGAEREKLLKNQNKLDMLAVEGIIRIWNYSAQKSTSIFMDMDAAKAHTLVEECLADMAYGDDCFIPKATPIPTAEEQPTASAEENNAKATRNWSIVDGSTSKKFRVTIEPIPEEELCQQDNTAETISSSLEKNAPRLAAAAEN